MDCYDLLKKQYRKVNLAQIVQVFSFSLLYSYFIIALEVVEKLVDAGACLNIANKDGKTPLCCLIENQSKETIETVLPYLLEKGSDPNFGEALPLIAAAYLNQQRTTTMLLEHGANVDGMNSQGNTALTTILNDYCDSTKGMFIIEISTTAFCVLFFIFKVFKLYLELFLCLILTYLFHQPMLIKPKYHIVNTRVCVGISICLLIPICYRLLYMQDKCRSTALFMLKSNGFFFSFVSLDTLCQFLDLSKI